MTSANDYEGIRRLFAEFSHSYDMSDADGLAACFAADGVFDTASAFAELEGSYQGRVNIAGHVQAARDYNHGRTRHSAVQSLIDIDGQTARATSYVIVTRDYGPPEVPGDLTHAELSTTGIYFDELRNVDGHWLFARRTFRHDGQPEVLERLGKPVAAGR
jgi:hypothetical protein